jgi:hypothetical protein
MAHILMHGFDVANIINERSSVPDLQHNIETTYPHTRLRQHATNEVGITSIKFLPFAGMNMLQVQSTTSTDGRPYKQTIQLMKVSFSDTDSPDVTTITAGDGTKFYLRPLDLSRHTVRVRCSCLDFYFRFATWNHGDQSIAGPAPKPYVRKTVNMPEVNPDHTPGICKHLLKIFERMRTQSIIL